MRAAIVVDGVRAVTPIGDGEITAEKSHAQDAAADSSELRLGGNGVPHPFEEPLERAHQSSSSSSEVAAERTQVLPSES